MAIRARRCYATSANRTLLEWDVGDMPSELRGIVAAHGGLERVDVVCNGEPVPQHPHGADGVVRRRLGQRSGQARQHCRVQGIARLRPVQGQQQHVIGGLVAQQFFGHGGSPWFRGGVAAILADAADHQNFTDHE